jgi:multidrug resistance efflux pump
MKKEFHDTLKSDTANYIKEPIWTKTLARIIVSIFLFFIIILAITPWQQTSQGTGKFIAFNPNDRVQSINSNTSGRINKWYVRDGSQVKKDDPLVEIIDNDPQFIERLKLERDASLRKYEANKAMSETSLLNYKRQEDLYKQGLSSQLKFEKSKIEYKKYLSSEASSAVSLAKAEVRFSRQKTQLITAPRDGIILRVLHGSGSVVVKEGDVLARFVPKTVEPAVEIFVSGNDLPLIYPGRLVRLQFEGWPAVQFSGWPSIAIGTFGGIVRIIDPSASSNGKFRVIITPQEGKKWPSNSYIRQGTRVYGWVLLNTVQLGYELWRQFNGFPSSLDAPPKDLIDYQKNRKTYKKKSDNRETGDKYEE